MGSFSYLIAKKFSEEGCLAVQTEGGKALAGLVTYLGLRTLDKGIQILTVSDTETYGEYKPYIGDKIPSYGQGKIRCWSLSALLGVIPQPDISRKSPDIFRNLEGTWSIRSRVSSEFAQQVDGYINLVDACVDMILELHRFKKL